MTEGIARRTEAVGSQENATAPDVVARIEADIAPSLNYASWQNSVPLVRSLEVVNTSGELLSGLELRLTTSPPFARGKVWRIEQLGPRQSLAMRDRDVEFDADYLAGLNEAERGVLRFTLHQRDELLAETTYPTRVLARDEWGGTIWEVECLLLDLTNRLNSFGARNRVSQWRHGKFGNGRVIRDWIDLGGVAEGDRQQGPRAGRSGDFKLREVCGTYQIDKNTGAEG